ncbi:hypothetical protein GCM10007916_26220 [Psychromonas marina]|uniref:Outer membrane protein beta-barrel domain-containing protein n=1 Tax=Psychromonas marina TaxID=88364 RepID=A0ABQ6E2X1_9GAMM|nr:hypothetical protein [Psychromonas marina]GLS91553.1 hypothetical protein GCM10007916_26220 [Psychromonas marina]
MKILTKTLLLSLCTSPFVMADDEINYLDYRAANSAINYSFINIAAGAKGYQEINNNLTVAGINGQALLNESFIFKLGYKAEFYDETINATEISFQDNFANIGIGWRYPILKSTDLEIDGNLIYYWNSETDNDDIGLKVGAALNHGFGETFDATLGIHYQSIDQTDIGSIELAFTKYITRYVGVGIDGYVAQFNDSELDKTLGNIGYLGVHLKLAFY